LNGILAWRKYLFQRRSNQGGRGCLTANKFVGWTAKFRRTADDGNLPEKGGGCNPAKKITGRLTGE
jgi:hypothetical protein